MMTNHLSQDGRAPFQVQESFIETAFEQRFQTLLRHAWQARSWHVIAAVPGSGKSLGINDLIAKSGGRKAPKGTTPLPLLAFHAPKSATHQQDLRLDRQPWVG